MDNARPVIRHHKEPPRYVRARDAILTMIQSGEYPPGSHLPPETELCSMLGVSRVILREALRVLGEDNVIIRRHGLPTVVSHPFPILQSDLNKNFSFSEVIRLNGFSPGFSSLKVMNEQADQRIAAKLGIKTGDPVQVIQRVRTADGRPLAYTVDIFEKGKVQASLEDFQKGVSIYDQLERQGTPVHHGLARILPVKAGMDIGEKLAINPEAVILVIEQVDYTKDGKPLLYTEEYHLRQAFQFTVYRER